MVGRDVDGPVPILYLAGIARPLLGYAAPALRQRREEDDARRRGTGHGRRRPTSRAGCRRRSRSRVSTVKSGPDSPAQWPDFGPPHTDQGCERHATMSRARPEFVLLHAMLGSGSGSGSRVRAELSRCAGCVGTDMAAGSLAKQVTALLRRTVNVRRKLGDDSPFAHWPETARGVGCTLAPSRYGRTRGHPKLF